MFFNIKEISDIVFGFNLFLNACLFIPQAWKIFKTKSASGSSLITFAGFNFIQLSGIANGYFDHDHALMYGYMCSLITCGSVTLLTTFYTIRNKNNTSQPELQNTYSENLHLLTAVLNKLPYHVYWKDINGNYLGCNIRQAESAGCTVSEMIGKSAKDLPWKEWHHKIQAEEQKVMKQKISISTEESGINKKGKTVHYLTTRSPLLNNSNNIIGIVGISVDITEKKSEHDTRTLKLKKQKKVAEEQARTAELLAASIAHELRTPLSSVALASSTLKALQKTKKLNKVQLDILTNIPSQLEQTVHTAKTFIDMMLIQVNMKEIKLAQTQTEASNLITALLNDYPLYDEDKKLIHSDLDDKLKLNIDSTLVKHVLYNLTKNAIFSIKHADKGEITITSKQTQKTISIIFKDTGMGIDKETLPDIFKPFFSKTRHGTGIGLAFCRKVMEAHGGSITCKSRLGDFTAFELRFPIK